MQNDTRKENGITLVALVITIIILLIIVSITVYEGKNLIKEAKVQTIETNMITIKAKAKSYLEEIDAANYGVTEDENKVTLANDKYGLKLSSESNSNVTISNPIYYEVTTEALENMGLTDISLEEETYLVVYDSKDYKNMDIVYVQGINVNGTTCYTLTQLQEEQAGQE